MEKSQVSTDDGDMIEKRVLSYNYYSYPCHFIGEAVRAFIKCLGIETKAQEENDDGEKETEPNPEKFNPSNQLVQLQDDTDPSVPETGSSEADPAPSSTTTETSEVAASTRVILSARPPITSGGGGQTNRSTSAFIS